MKKTVQLLGSYIDANYPIIYINHFDSKLIDNIIKDILDNQKVVEFQNGLGIVDFYNKSITLECDLLNFLKNSEDDGYTKEHIVILKDIHNDLDNKEIIGRLKYIAEKQLYNKDYHLSIIIISSAMKIPKELEEYITILDIPLQSIDEIKNTILEYTKNLNKVIENDTLNEISAFFRGLNQFQIIQILKLAHQNDGILNLDDKSLIIEQKEQTIKKSGLLEIVHIQETINDIGGIFGLKGWLEKKKYIFKNIDKAIKFKVDIPKGIMIVGMPGCGKSLTAKSTATLFNLPLVRLDIGRLLGKYVGESEENMRKALKLAEAISPCILWIDEIEKAFAGVNGAGGGNEVTTRLFGNFLTWMQENKTNVFVVATANNISNIPPEFLRKGRFDELFYVDLPDKEERRKILEIHLEKRNQKINNIDITSLVEVTEGYSGADLEAIVKEALETVFIQERKKVTTEDLKKAQKNITPISTVMKKKYR